MDAITQFLGWVSSQPTWVQVAVGAGILIALYPVLVVVRLIGTALYGAFRGLG
jgi:hypothetical protein